MPTNTFNNDVPLSTRRVRAQVVRKAFELNGLEGRTPKIAQRIRNLESMTRHRNDKYSSGACILVLVSLLEPRVTFTEYATWDLLVYSDLRVASESDECVISDVACESDRAVNFWERVERRPFRDGNREWTTCLECHFSIIAGNGGDYCSLVAHLSILPAP